MGDYNRELEEQQKGLYPKYTLINNETDKPEQGEYFILKPLEDPAAIKALEVYAEHTHNKLLANDIYDWLVSLGLRSSN